MARIVFIAAIFLMTFSPHLMAAEAQLKKTAPLTQIDTPACITAHEKCLKIATSKDLMEANTPEQLNQKLQNCIDACETAQKECSPKKKTKSDLTHTRFGVASSHRLNCKNAQKTKTTQQNKQK